MSQDIQKKKRLVVIIYFIAFGTIFFSASYVAWNRRIDDARSAKDAAAIMSKTEVAPVASR